MNKTLPKISSVSVEGKCCYKNLERHLAEYGALPDGRRFLRVEFFYPEFQKKTQGKGRHLNSE